LHAVDGVGDYLTAPVDRYEGVFGNLLGYLCFSAICKAEFADVVTATDAILTSPFCMSAPASSLAIISARAWLRLPVSSADCLTSVMRWKDPRPLG